MSVRLRKDSPYWFIEFELLGERVRQSSRTSDRRKACELEQRLRHEVYEHRQLGREKPSTMTIRQAVDRYISTHLRFKKRRARTAKGDVSVLNCLIEMLGGDEVLISTLTTKFIAGFRDNTLIPGRKPATVNKYLANLGAILRKAHRKWETLSVLPVIELLPLSNQRTRWLTLDEERSLLSAAYSQRHLHDLLLFLLDTGARLSEATTLCWDDLNLEREPRGSVLFRETKTGKPRSVPLTGRVEVMLLQLRTAKPAGQDRVFLYRTPGYSWRGTRPAAKPFENPHGAWATAVKRSGLKNVRMHDLRHTFASRLAQRGVTLQTVSELLGHKSLAMTMRYAHLAVHNFDTAIDFIDPPASHVPQGRAG